MQILKLDLTINGTEYFIGDAEATERGFKSLTGHNWVIYSDDEATLQNEGCATIDLSDEDYINLFSEISGLDADKITEAHFVMCLWEQDETGEQTHIESCYTLAKLAKLSE